MYANAAITRLTTISTAMTPIHQGCWLTSSPRRARAGRRRRRAGCAPPRREGRDAIRARSVMDVPFEETFTMSPWEIFLARASARASSTSPSRRWKSSSGVRSTAGPEKSGLNVRRRSPLPSATGFAGGASTVWARVDAARAAPPARRPRRTRCRRNRSPRPPRRRPRRAARARRRSALRASRSRRARRGTARSRRGAGAGDAPSRFTVVPSRSR